MAMDWQMSNEFDRIMRDGDWHLGKAESLEGSEYYSEAKSHYFEAMNYYREANILATRFDDCRRYDAIRKYDECKRSVHELAYKSYESQGR